MSGSGIGRISSGLAFGFLLGTLCVSVLADGVSLQAEAERIVSPYSVTMKAAPNNFPNRTCGDAPLLGNGGMGVVMAGKPGAWPLQFWFTKSNFGKMRHDHRKGGPRPFGNLSLNMPALDGGSWNSEQFFFPAITEGTFTKDAITVRMRAYVAATEDILIVELRAEGATVDVSARVEPTPGRGSTEETGEQAGLLWASRRYHTEKPLAGTHPAHMETSAGAAVTVVGQEDMNITLAPGKTVTLALAMKTNFDTESPLDDAMKLVADLTLDKVKNLEQAHRQWWREFWAKGLVEIDEPDVQKAYYAAGYEQGIGFRDKDFPPGLFGLWLTSDDPSWAGDYHLNFDFQSAYYSLYKNNHIEQADTFEQPILDFMERGKWYAEHARGVRGVYYPVGIWAKGVETSRQPGIRDNTSVEKSGVFLGQRTNAAYCAVPMAMRWFHTYDLDYARKVYPFLFEVANFWEDFLVWEPVTNAVAPASAGTPAVEGRYVVYGDSAHEDIHTGGSGDVNSPMSLGLIHNVFTLVLDMSKEMGVDADRRDKWQHILDNLSDFPTFEKDGETVFRYSEKGTEWVVDNSVGIQHIYPAGAVSLDDTELARIGRNMIKAKNRWNNDNGTNSMYPAAVRVGYDPATILKNLQNLFFANSARTDSGIPRSLEEGSTVPNTIHEMLCMSHRQVLRVFAVWPKEKNARFWNLRAEGAFLVSSAFTDGQVRFVKIHSEKGRDCTFVNPWPGKAVAVFKDGKKVDTLNGERIVMKTNAGETLVLGMADKGIFIENEEI